MLLLMVAMARLVKTVCQLRAAAVEAAQVEKELAAVHLPHQPLA
jgi:hypothetical protein